jgi:hypothetical protein
VLPTRKAVAAARALATALLIALPLVLPFEAPLFPVGPLTITSAELALYALLAAWLVQSGGALVALARQPMARAVMLWMAALAASALAASPPRAAALKFALRSLGGAMVFFAACDLARSAVVARRVVVAIVAGAAVSALTAVVEIAVPGSAPLWRPFHPQTFTALGVARASGAFAYPTMAAMYWEAALPLCGVLIFVGRPRRWSGALVMALAGLEVAAIVLSATRAALAGAILASGALLLLGWRAGGRVRFAAAATLAATALLIPALVGFQSLRGHRLRSASDRSWFGARYAPSPPHLSLAAGSAVDVTVAVENTGTLAWPHAGRDAVHLSHHWELADAQGWRLVDFEGHRTRLPADIAPGETVSLVGTVDVPRRAGRYRLRWDLVRESVTWFSERGNATGDQLVDVTASDAVAAPAPLPVERRTLEDVIGRRAPGRPELWRAALALWRRHPLLGVGPDNFRHLYPQALPSGNRWSLDERLHANSLYLETLADLGLCGALALALLLGALVRAVRAHITDGNLLRLACGVAAGTFFVHGLVDTFLAFTPLYGLQWLLLGLTAQTNSSP